MMLVEAWACDHCGNKCGHESRFATWTREGRGKWAGQYQQVDLCELCDRKMQEHSKPPPGKRKRRV